MLAYRYQTVLSGLNFDNRFEGATEEVKTFEGDVELYLESAFLGNLFNNFDKVGESVVQFNLLLSLHFLLLEFVHVIESFPTTSQVQIISNVAYLFEELDILYLLIANHDMILEVKVDYNDKFILCTGLKEGMLNV